MRGQGKSHNEAWNQVALPAVASGIVSAATTLLGARGGIEGALARGDTAAMHGALRSSWKAFFKGAATENLEELPDELASEIFAAWAKDPNADIAAVIGDFLKARPEELAAIGLLGGAGEVRRARVENVHSATVVNGAQPPPPRDSIPESQPQPPADAEAGTDTEGKTAIEAETPPKSGEPDAEPEVAPAPVEITAKELPPLPPETPEQIAEREAHQAGYDSVGKTPQERLD